MANFFKSLFEKKAQKVDVARRFELLARVGQGSMSKVWRARDAMSGRMLAVKVLDKAKTERFEARFVGLKKPSEGEISASLQHKNIVRTLEFGTTTGDEPYLVMEFVEGVSLSFLVDMQNEQMREHRLNYVIQLGEALEYLHRQNWIHRDICPRNVMVDQDNVVKLIDFGLVVPNTPDFQKPGNRTGTANYMAPELIKRQRTDQRIDVYSYAVTCYEMYSKRLPWDVPVGETIDTVLQHINKPPTPIQELAPDIHPKVAEVIMKGLLTNPADRWQSISEMLLPLRKAHEEIEEKKELDRQRKSRAAKNKPAKNDVPTKKVAADDAFFEELLLGDGQTRAVKPKTTPTTSDAKRAAEQPAPLSKSKPLAPSSKPSPVAAKDRPAQASKPQKPSTSAAAASNKARSEDSNSQNGAEDEFEGIEIEVEGHKHEEPAPAKPTSPVSGSGRKLAALLIEDDKSHTDAADEALEGIEIESEGSLPEDDEPVLRLPDDDDEDLIPGIEIDEEATETRPRKPAAGK